MGISVYIQVSQKVTLISFISCNPKFIFGNEPKWLQAMCRVLHRSEKAAVKLGVTAHAVSFHVRRIYEKLHVHSRSDAVAKALRSGLFD